jgi:hypothetical protein
MTDTYGRTINIGTTDDGRTTYTILNLDGSTFYVFIPQRGMTQDDALANINLRFGPNFVPPLSAMGG